MGTSIFESFVKCQDIGLWLLKKYPHSIVNGIDYSIVSVEKSKKVNNKAVAEGRCTVLKGNVMNMPYSATCFDAVTAFETIYFWQDLPKCFCEIYRVLKPGGTFLICNEVSGDEAKDEKWTKIIEEMTIYKDTELKIYLGQAMFRNIQIRKKNNWLCVTAEK